MTEHGSEDRTRRRGGVLLGCVIVITVILAGSMLRATAVVMIPIVFSVFLALLVAPVDRWGRRHAPERAAWLGHAAAMGVILLVLLAFVGSIWIAAQQLMERLPDNMGVESAAIPLAGPADPSETVPPNASDGSGQAEEAGEEAGIADRLGTLFSSAGDSFLGRLVDWAAGYASTILATAGTVLGGAVLVFFLTLLMLIEGPAWRDKMRALRRGPSEGVVTDAADEIAEKLRRYLWTRTVIGVLTALLYVGWLWLFGGVEGRSADRRAGRGRCRSPSRFSSCDGRRDRRDERSERVARVPRQRRDHAGRARQAPDGRGAVHRRVHARPCADHPEPADGRHEPRRERHVAEERARHHLGRRVGPRPRAGQPPPMTICPSRTA
jgi:hypothetical protein